MKINKTLLIAGTSFILAGVIAFGILNKVYKNKMNDIENSYDAEIIQIENQRDAAIAHADSVDFMYARHKTEMDSMNTVVAKLEWENDQFKVELTNAWHIIFDATVDENYNSLHVRYPTEDTLKFPFSGEQVKGIALDLVKLDYKDSLYNNQLRIAKLLREQLMKSNDMVEELNIERQDLEYLNARLLDQLAAKTEELRMSEEEIAKLRRRVRRIGAGGTGATIGLLALLLLL